MQLKPFKRPLRDAVPPLRCLHDTHLEPTHVLVWKAAPTVLLFSVVICFAFLVVSPSSLVMKDPMEVCALSRGVMFQLLSTSLQSGIRFFHHPIPTNPSACLTVSFPLRENDGLTTFRIRTQDGLGSACSPVAFHLRQGKGEALAPSHVPFGSSLLFSTFGLLVLTTFISGSHMLAIPSDPSPRPPRCW
jgi:hypothetical protein